MKFLKAYTALMVFASSAIAYLFLIYSLFAFALVEKEDIIAAVIFGGFATVIYLALATIVEGVAWAYTKLKGRENHE